ncbi:MAG: ribonuclease activity regulator RraA [Anaerolineaceae bacterium]|nr:ribonuclease activity regulator RraA [Anaerolineaceae bacterium]MCY3907627.1 ribonuclease activity regulator RraA [Anaerolineaceae bacterium]
MSDQRPPVVTEDIRRPPAHLIEGLKDIGSATASAELSKLGIRDAQIRGPLAMTPGVSVVGPALTLQCMPRREDMIDTDEYANTQRQLHRHVLYHTQPGDVVVVDARGDMGSGVFGEMMLTYFQGRGGIGVVIDGCIRDFGHARTLDLGLWLRGATPNFHTQTNIMPFAVNRPIACGGTLVMPGDIIVADDDGAVNVPVALAEELIRTAGEHADWEVFSRMKLAGGGDLRKYYPLREDAREEYEAWRRSQE